MKRKMIAFLVAALMLCSMPVTTASAATLADRQLMLRAEAFVMERVASYAAMDLLGSTWDENTVVKNFTPLYAPNDSVNGFIFHFRTDGIDTGFMQIGIYSEEFYLVNMGFQGQDVLTSLIYRQNRVAGSTDAAIPDQGRINTSVHSLCDSNIVKVYYTGGFEYYLSTDDNHLISLHNNEILETDASSLSGEHAFYQEKRVEALAARALEQQSIAQNRTLEHVVPGYSSAAPYMKSMYNWMPAYTGHCVPTAAVNDIMYWKYGRGVFANHSPSGDANYVFTWFYQTLDTGNGTNRVDILPTYVEYFTSYSGLSPSSFHYGWDALPSFGALRAVLDNDYPINLVLHNYQTTQLSAHSVNVWGYAINGSEQLLRISDNWQLNHETLFVDPTLHNLREYSFCGSNGN